MSLLSIFREILGAEPPHRLVGAAVLRKGPLLEDDARSNLLNAAMAMDPLSLEASLLKLKALDEYQPVASGNRKSFLTKAELNKLADSTCNHVVARLDRAEDYGVAGFCFGRAMTAHLLALRMGLDKDAVRKIWVAGNLTWRDDGSRWNFHVATAVRGPDGWYAIDPEFGRLQRIADWRTKLDQKVSVTGQTFVTSASRFDAESAAKYDPETLKDGDFGNYFQDLLKQFKIERPLQTRTRPAVSKGWW